MQSVQPTHPKYELIFFRANEWPIFPYGEFLEVQQAYLLYTYTYCNVMNFI